MRFGWILLVVLAAGMIALGIFSLILSWWMGI